jgi:hypothetical protein
MKPGERHGERLDGVLDCCIGMAGGVRWHAAAHVQAATTDAVPCSHSPAGVGLLLLLLAAGRAAAANTRVQGTWTAGSHQQPMVAVAAVRPSITSNQQALAEPIPVDSGLVSFQGPTRPTVVVRPEGMAALTGLPPGMHPLSALAVQTTPSYLSAMQQQQQQQHMAMMQQAQAQAQVAIAAAAPAAAAAAPASSSSQGADAAGASAAAAAPAAADWRQGLPALLARGGEGVSNLGSIATAALRAFQQARESGAAGAGSHDASVSVASVPSADTPATPAGVLEAGSGGAGGAAAASVAAPLTPLMMPSNVIALPKAAPAPDRMRVDVHTAAVAPLPALLHARQQQQQQQQAAADPAAPRFVAIPELAQARVATAAVDSAVATAATAAAAAPAAAPAAPAAPVNDMSASAPVARLTLQLPQKVHVGFASAAVHRGAPMNPFDRPVAPDAVVNSGAVTPEQTPTWVPAA